MTVIKVLSKAHCPNWVAGIVNDNAESQNVFLQFKEVFLRSFEHCFFVIQKHVDPKSWAKTFFFVEVRGLENISFCVKNTILTAGESEQNYFFLS